MSDKTVLITGVGRANSIAYGIAEQLAQDGWNLVLNYWHPYDQRLEMNPNEQDLIALQNRCEKLGSKVTLVSADLELPQTPEQLINAAVEHGDLHALILSHCESVDSDIFSTTIDAWDRSFAVNARASWLLVKHFAQQTKDQKEHLKKIVALTSDHAAFNLPYGASKGALDRLIIAAGIELGPQGFRSNLINPGPINTGWMNTELEEYLTQQTPAGRLGMPQDIAHLVSFLLSPQGDWINGQLLKSDGGFSAR